MLRLIAFHDQAAAQEFAATYSEILDHSGGKSNPHGIATHADVVFITIGPGASEFARLQPAIWKASGRVLL
jgi:hypothetical protein